MSASEWDTELVESVAEVLRKHRMDRHSLSAPSGHEWWGHCRGCGFEGPRRSRFYVGWELDMADDKAIHQAPAILDAITASGRAIVDLPEPYEEDGMQHWPVEQHWRGKPIRSGSVFIRRSDGHMAATSVSNPHDCPGDARSLAAALLAAAAAEESQ